MNKGGYKISLRAMRDFEKEKKCKGKFSMDRAKVKKLVHIFALNFNYLLNIRSDSNVLIIFLAFIVVFLRNRGKMGSFLDFILKFL